MLKGWTEVELDRISVAINLNAILDRLHYTP
jgi:hypothetical protein